MPAEVKIIDGKKQCSKCKLDLPLNMFNKQYTSKCGYTSHCKKCKRGYSDSELARFKYNELQRLRYPNYKDRQNAYKNEKILGNLSRSDILHMKRKYGISGEEYIRLASVQDNKCAICGEVENYMNGKKPRKLSVDHCHKTGKIRALLCSQCNKGIGCLGDNPERLIKAAKYIKQYEQ